MKLEEVIALLPTTGKTIDLPGLSDSVVVVELEDGTSLCLALAHSVDDATNTYGEERDVSKGGVSVVETTGNDTMICISGTRYMATPKGFTPFETLQRLKNKARPFEHKKKDGSVVHVEGECKIPGSYDRDTSLSFS